MNIDQAVHEAAQATDEQLRKTYGVALARGATNTGCMPEEERLYGTLRLLTLATLRLPDLAMIAQLMHIDAAADDPVVLFAAHDVAGGAPRLAHRALETDGRDLSYEIDAWIDDALLLAGVELAREQRARPHRPDALGDPGAHGRHRRDLGGPDAGTRGALAEHPTSVRLLPRRTVVRAPVRPRVEPGKHQRSMPNSRVCTRSPSSRVIWSRFGPKPRLFRVRRRSGSLEVPPPATPTARGTCQRLPVQAPGELRALALAQAAERLAGRDPAAVQDPKRPLIRDAPSYGGRGERQITVARPAPGSLSLSLLARPVSRLALCDGRSR